MLPITEQKKIKLKKCVTDTALCSWTSVYILNAYYLATA